jgi:hypothetical protein
MSLTPTRPGDATGARREDERGTDTRCEEARRARVRPDSAITPPTPRKGSAKAADGKLPALDP